MKAKELPELWIKQEITLQKKMLSQLENSGVHKVTGFQNIIEMRKQFLQIAEEHLHTIQLKNL